MHPWFLSRVQTTKQTSGGDLGQTAENNTGCPKKIEPFFYFFFLGAQCVESGASCTDWIFEKGTIFFGYLVLKYAWKEKQYGFENIQVNLDGL